MSQIVSTDDCSRSAWERLLLSMSLPDTNEQVFSVVSALKLEEESYCCYLHNEAYHAQAENSCLEQERFDQRCPTS